ncbi:MAG TPA: hypothetical protein VIK52_10670, partial [Opitutaceae bacterium]
SLSSEALAKDDGDPAEIQMDGHVASLLAMTGREFIALLRKTRLRSLLPALAMTRRGDFIGRAWQQALI